MNTIKSWKFWAMILGLAILAISLYILWYLFIPNTVAQEMYWRAKAQEVEVRRQAWSDQKITKYKIGTRYSSGHDEGCLTEYIVDDNIVTQVIVNECPYPSFDTVEGLFSFIKGNNGGPCGPNGCDCDGPMIIKTTYDEVYKFPKEMWIGFDGQATWMFRKPGLERLLPKFCTLLGTVGVSTEVVSFEPLK